MPPRKRAASSPTPDREAAEPLAEDKTMENPNADTAHSAPQAADAPCTECFPGGWPADATSVGCGHGTWGRDFPS
jgi:hypothetical protein